MTDDYQGYFRSLNILHFSMLLGLSMIGTIMLYLKSTEGIESDDNTMFLMIAGAVSISTIVLSSILYTKRKDEGSQLANVESKMEAYRADSIVRWALLEGGSLMVIIFFYMFGNYLYLPFFCIGLVMLGMARPTPNKFVEEYKIRGKEKDELLNSVV